MSQVVGLDGRPVDSQTLEMDHADAKVALKNLLERMEAGELKTTRWLFIFDQPVDGSPGSEFTTVEDSGVTVERAVHMVELVKFMWLRMSFGENQR